MVRLGLWQLLEINAVNREGAEHSALSRQLMEFFKGVTISGRPFRTAESDEDINALVPHVDEWYSGTQNWLKSNMGDAALAAFLDDSGHQAFNLTGAQAFSQTLRKTRKNALNILDFTMRNLQAIANRKVFDPQ